MPWRAYPVTPFQANAYLYWQAGGEALVVDPGEVPPGLLRDAAGKQVRYILLTHGHLDHVAGAPEARTAVGAPVVAPRAELQWLEQQGDEADVQELFMPEVLATADQLVDGGDRLSFADDELQVLAVPGHSPGHVCYYLPAAGLVFSGDTLMHGTLGRGDLPGGDMSLLLDAVRSRILALPGETQVLPGHGPATTVADERRANPWLRAGGA